MSILIKGMEMPINCIKCPMQFGGMCFAVPTGDETWERGRPDWCPLVEVPTPHGRLIDAKKLMLYLADYALQECPTWGANGIGNADAYEAIDNCMNAVNDAPTVIEAEE